MSVDTELPVEVPVLRPAKAGRRRPHARRPRPYDRAGAGQPPLRLIPRSAEAYGWTAAQRSPAEYETIRRKPVAPSDTTRPALTPVAPSRAGLARARQAPASNGRVQGAVQRAVPGVLTSTGSVVAAKSNLGASPVSASAAHSASAAPSVPLRQSSQAELCTSSAPWARLSAAGSDAAPVSPTVRGRRVALAGAAMLALAVIVGSWLSQRGAAQASPDSASAQVVVSSGDTLWSIAHRVAPEADPRVEVRHLMQMNHLASADLSPGQVLSTR